MNMLAAQMSQYFVIAADSVAAGMLFAAFSSVRQKWRVLSFAGVMILFRLPFLFIMTDSNYISSILLIFAMFGLSFWFFDVSVPIRFFLTCFFGAAKEICLFIAFGSQTAVNNAVMGGYYAELRTRH